MTPQHIFDLTATAPVVVVVCDGMDDDMIPALGNVTPWEAACCPRMKNMDRDSIQLIPNGMEASTNVALLSLLGYEGACLGYGRAAFEALGSGVDLGVDNVVMRCNLVSIEDNRMSSHTARNIDAAHARKVVEILNREFRDTSCHFHCGDSFRCLMSMDCDGFDAVCVPPHNIIGEDIVLYPARGTQGGLLNEIMKRARKVLKHNDTATGIWLWACGRAVPMPKLEELHYGISAAMVCGTDLMRGIAKGCGIEIVNVEGATGDCNTNLRGKAAAALDAAVSHNLVVVHVEACDELAHAGDAVGKMKMIEKIDDELITPLSEAPVHLVVLSDHATSSLTRRHLSRPTNVYLSRV